VADIAFFPPATGFEGRSLRDTTSLCPVCHAEVPAAYLASGEDRVLFARSCPAHGSYQSDLGPHAAFYERMFRLDDEIKRRWPQKLTQTPLRTAPYLMRDRASLVMLEVTEKCNLTCPMCFAGSSPLGRHYTLAEIQARIDEVIALEGRGISFQISGGEPTVRKDLDRIVRMCYDAGCGHVEVISNGIRIAKDPAYAKQLKQWGVTSLYLQFDSTDDDHIEQLRGERLWWVRERALEALADAGMPVVLAVSILPGLNDNQIGPTMDVIARSRANIVAVNFQCATPFGGRFDVDAPRKLRLPDMIQLMGEQLGLGETGFFPVGSGSPLCNAYARVAFREGRWQHALPSLTVEDFLDLQGDDPVDFVRGLTVGLNESLPHMIKQVMRHPRLIRKLAPLVGDDPLAWLRGKSARQTTIYIKPFMDESDIDMERVERCCYHNVTPRGIVSFCAMNILGRGEPVAEQAFEGKARTAPAP
jgi:7,8-dihydro-6-hydroxymethylpterin dimethyltransferase